MQEHTPLSLQEDVNVEPVAQLNDRSELSILYTTPKNLWDGEIMTVEARQAKKEAERRAVQTSIRTEFVKIGLLIPVPFLLASTGIALGVSVISESSVNIALLPSIVAVALWGLLSFLALKAVFSTFYQHALKAGPFIVLMLALLGISIQGLFIATLPLHNLNPLLITLYVNLGMLVISVVLTGIVLSIWVANRIHGGVKLGLIGLIALSILGTTLGASLL